VPLADAGDAPIVKAILAIRCGVQVDQDLEPGGLRPLESIVQRANASIVGRRIVKDKVRHRHAHGVQAQGSDMPEIIGRDIGRAVTVQPLDELLTREHARQVVLILRLGAGKEVRVHPFLQHHPVAEVYASDLVHGWLLA